MTDVSTGLGLECSRAGQPAANLGLDDTHAIISSTADEMQPCAKGRSLIELAHAEHALLPHPARVLRHAE